MEYMWIRKAKKAIKRVIHKVVHIVHIAGDKMWRIKKCKWSYPPLAKSYPLKNVDNLIQICVRIKEDSDVLCRIEKIQAVGRTRKTGFLTDV